MNAQLQRVSFLAAPVAIVVLVTSHWAGRRVLVTCAIAAAAIVAGTLWQRRSPRPEVPTALIFLVLEVDAGASVLVSGGAHSPLVPLLAAPVCIQGTCLRPRLFLGCCLTGALVATPALLLPAPATVSTPPDAMYLFATVALLVALATSGHVLAAADLVVRDRADVDPLTGLHNRATLGPTFDELRRRASAAGFQVSLVMLDVDHFKRINDDHGHATGDCVLQTLAEQLRSCVRGSDLIYRVGGEEFLVVLPGDDAPAAELVAERIRCRVAEHPIGELRVTVSLGVASATGADVDFDRLCQDADAALYAAKAAGRNRVIVSSPSPLDAAGTGSTCAGAEALPVTGN
jgi:diguanylate cyclase (GGDEF)-like protein